CLHPLSEGDKQGVKVQFTFRDNANQGGGNVLTGEKLKQASADISNVVKKFGSRTSFVLDTFNQGGKSASQDWADMQTTLIKAARNSGYKGTIVVEDSNWGGGLTAGPQSGLVKFADQLKAANGEGNPALIGSFHVYARESEAS
ncbi:cellulase family glycosylhydrolase, partial [Pseudomonas savastanoi]